MRAYFGEIINAAIQSSLVLTLKVLLSQECFNCCHMVIIQLDFPVPLRWRHNEHNGVSTVYSGADQRKHQSSASLAFVRGIHRWPVNSPHKGPVTRKSFHLMTSSCWKVLMVWPENGRRTYLGHTSYAIVASYRLAGRFSWCWFYSPLSIWLKNTFSYFILRAHDLNSITVIPCYLVEW